KTTEAISAATRNGWNCARCPAPVACETRIFTARTTPIGKHHNAKVSTPAKPTPATALGPSRLTNSVSTSVIVLTDNIEITIGQASWISAGSGFSSQLRGVVED